MSGLEALKPLPKMVEGGNPSGITPLEYNVLVRPKKAEEKTAAGLYKPQEYVEREQWGETHAVVIAISPLAFNYESGAPKPRLGEYVVYPKAAGTSIKGADGETYRLIKDKDVLATMEGQNG